MEVSIIKIHILGGAGTGKSFIANKLSKLLNIPHYDLDDIFWDNSVKHYGIKAPQISRDQKLEEIIKQNSWIIEGVYISWLEPSFSVADKVFVLVPSVEIQENRIWDRFYKRLSGIEICKKQETFEGVTELIKWNRNYNESKIPHFIEHCQYKEKLIVIDDNDKIYDLLMNNNK